MATQKHTSLEQLKSLAIRVNSNYARKSSVTALQETVDAIEVPTKVSDLINDSEFQTKTEVETQIQTAITASENSSDEVVTTLPAASEAKANVTYFVKNTTSGHYDMYKLIDGELEWIDDTTVDMSGYVEKETGKMLSSNDYTDDDKAKLDDIQFATDTEFNAMLDEVFGAEA